MVRDTIVPRVGTKCVHLLTFSFVNGKQLSQIEQGKIQSALDQEFIEPDEMGQLAITFTTSVTQNVMLADEVQVETTTSTINDSIIDRMVSIIEETADVTVESWTDDAVMKRKSLGVDEA